MERTKDGRIIINGKQCYQKSIDYIITEKDLSKFVIKNFSCKKNKHLPIDIGTKIICRKCKKLLCNTCRTREVEEGYRFFCRSCRTQVVSTIERGSIDPHKRRSEGARKNAMS